MRHFLSQLPVNNHSGVSTTSRSSVALAARSLCLIAIFAIAFVSSSFGQVSMLTARVNNSRWNANTQETMLTLSNVNSNNFGHLLSLPVDYVVMAQPLYVANVSIPGQGTHNVVYVVTQKDSVYAFDADTGAQLWYASMLYGGTTASGKYLPCGTGPGFNQEGIVGTPVIDPATNTMYLVAKTLLNTTVRHHIHALDITTGAERPGSPVLIQAQSTSKKGHVMVFNSQWQKNRPGLLLLNGVIYIGFGSNYCNGNDSGWVLSYNESSLTQIGVFNTSPDYGLTSIWQTGNGPAADEEGNVYVETAETGANGYDVPSGGQTFCNSVVKLTPSTVEVADYFTPWSVAYLNTHDLDLSSAGALVLPDQPGPYTHELVAGGKEGMVYVLNRDNMGMYSTNDTQIIQEFALVPGTTNDVLFGSPAYWNNNVYLAPNDAQVMAFPIQSNGTLGTAVETAKTYPGSHSPSISANGNANGIVWVLESNPAQMLAFNATNMQLLYATGQAPNKRDLLPPIGHFVTQTVANGKVYVGTQASLEIYGLLTSGTLTGGGGQSGTVATTLTNPIQVRVSNPYSGQPLVGATVNFSDGCIKAGAVTCGTFNPASAVTDSNGNVSSNYTLPEKAGTYTLTMSGTGFGSTTTTATGITGAATKIIAYGGSKQSGPVGSTLPNPAVVQAQDAYKNGVPGVTVTFAANHGGSVSPTSIVTDASGMARGTVTLPTAPATVTVTGSSTGFKNVTFSETAVVGAPNTLAVVSGNNQTAPAGTQLPLPLTVLVTDNYGNPVPNIEVTFTDNGAGGTFSTNTPTTGSNGQASVTYTLPTTPQSVTITASSTGVSSVQFVETGH